MIATEFEGTPHATVIIPSAGDSFRLQRCLLSLASIEDPQKCEVIIVLDGAGPDRDLAALRERGDWPWPIRWIENEVRKGPSRARNLGAAAARGQLLIFLDDDMTAGRGFLTGHLAAAEGHPGRAILGRIETRCEGRRDWCARRIEQYWLDRDARLAATAIPGFEDCFTGNLAVPAALFANAGGFDESLARHEDVELGIRIERAGGEFVYATAAAALQHWDKDPAAPVRDCWRTGSAAMEVWLRYPEFRRRMSFHVSGRRNARWVRRWLLDLGIEAERLHSLLRWLPETDFTREIHWFLQDLATARGASRRLADPGMWTALTEGTLILCYHRFCASVNGASEFVIAERMFRRQMERLVALGFRFLVAAEWAQAVRSASPVPGRTAVVTIDDGDASAHSIAFPVLRGLGIPATVFAVRDWIGQPGCIDLHQIETLRANGWEIGAHSLTHPHLSQLSEVEQWREIETLRSGIGGEVPVTFAYPYGDHGPTARRMTSEAGYLAAFGVHRDVAFPDSPLFNVPRLMIDGRWQLRHFSHGIVRGITLGGLP